MQEPPPSAVRKFAPHPKSFAAVVRHTALHTFCNDMSIGNLLTAPRTVEDDGPYDGAFISLHP